MFLTAVAWISIAINIIAILLDFNYFGTGLTNICIAGALIYFVDLCKDVFRIRTDVAQLRLKFAPTQAERDRDMQQQALDALEAERRMQTAERAHK